MTNIDEKLFAKIKSTYEITGSIRQTARETGTEYHKTVKILVTIGAYSSPRSKSIADCLTKGMSQGEICERLGIAKSTVDEYTPYSKGSYNNLLPSNNAKTIRRYREKNMRDI